MSDWYGLVIAVTTLIIVLCVSYMCLQLFKTLNPPDKCPRREQFRGWGQYRPACSAEWLSGRLRCKGTTGSMPSIDDELATAYRSPVENACRGTPRGP